MSHVVHVPPAQPPWHCDPNGIRCEHGHFLWFNETGYRADLRRMAGHAFLQCQKCEPKTYFLAVFVREPSPLVICYALSRECYEEWDKSTEPTPPTGELLHRLRDPQGRSHHPHWRPPR